MAITITAVLGRDLRTVYFLALDTSALQVPQAVTAVSGQPTVYINGVPASWSTLAPTTPVTAAPAGPGRGSATVSPSTLAGGGISARAAGRRSGGMARWVGAVGGAIPIWVDSTQNGCFVAYLLRSACQPSDVLTYSAPSGWLHCGSNAAPAATLATVINSKGKLEPQFGNWATGQPVAPWSPGIKTMGLGMNLPWQMRSVNGYSSWYQQNLIHKSSNPWSNATCNQDGFPTAIGSGGAGITFAGTSYPNEIDNRLTPTWPGIYTFVANETNPSSPMVVTLGNNISSNNGVLSTSATATAVGNLGGVTGLVNAGTLTNGVLVGRTWQWSFTYPSQTYPTTTSWNFNLTLTLNTPSGGAGPQSLAQQGMFLTGPGPNGAAQVPNQANPAAVDAQWVANLTARNGAGPSALRTVDSTEFDDGDSNTVDFVDNRQLTDFSWSNWPYQTGDATGTREISITAVRPYSPGSGSSNYVYLWDSWGGLATAASGGMLAPTNIVQRSGAVSVGKRGRYSPGGARWAPASGFASPGPFQVAVTAVNWLNWSGGAGGANLDNPANQWIQAEFVSASPHNLKTGQLVTFSIPATIQFTNSVGTFNGGNGFNGSGAIAWVTGANTFAATVYAGAENTNGGGYANCASNNTGLNSTVYVKVPDFGTVARAVHGQAVSQWTGTRLWLNLPPAGTPACWTAITNEYLRWMPSNSVEICVQYGNELWSGDLFSSPFVSMLGSLFNTTNTETAWYVPVYRANEAYQAVLAAVQAAGRTNPVSLIMGSQWNQPAASQSICQVASNAGIKFKYLAPAYYARIGFNAGYADVTPAIMSENWPVGSQLDWFRWYLVYNTGAQGPNGYIAGHLNAISSYYTLSGPAPVLVGYEGGCDLPLGMNSWAPVGVWMDSCYHPYAYDMYTAWASSAQTGGFKFVNQYCYCFSLQADGSGYDLYGIVHWHGEQPGRGDGSDGKAVNRFVTAQGGYPADGNCHYGPDGNTTGNGLGNVSPRLQAFLDWQAGANPPTGGTGSGARWFPQLSSRARAQRVKRS